MAIDPNNLTGTATLTFSDEFDALKLWDGASGWDALAGPQWGGRVRPHGTYPYNEELQWYVNPGYRPKPGEPALPNPFSVADGVLSITAMPAAEGVRAYIEGQSYTSGMLNTLNDFRQTYGYFEISAKVPDGQGLWPAFWLLPADGSWPPEIDVMEVLGSDPTTLYVTMHTGTVGAVTSTGTSVATVDLSAGFHTYGVDWGPTRITWYLDGAPVFSAATPSTMHDSMYLILNLAVGGTWPGSPDATTVFPASLQIDYVRVYAAKPLTAQALFALPESAAPATSVIGTKRADTLAGTAGHDLLDGRAGVDRMEGRAGDDTYRVDDARDQVIEAAGGGVDTVASQARSFVLPAHVENLVLTGSTAQRGTGNDLDNRLVSNDFGSTLDGGAGNDVLVAGRGADVLTGGAGADVFVFAIAPAQAGRVTDFQAGVDMLDLRGLFARAGYGGSDPLADGLLRLAHDGAGGTAVWFDADGSGAGSAVRVTTLEGCRPGTLHLQADLWFA